MIVKKNLDIFLKLLGKKDKLLFQYVVFLQLGGSILEAFGIALIIPILGIILGQDGSNLFFLRDINESLNISNKGSLLIFLVAAIIIISHNLQNFDNCDTNLLMKAYNLGYNLLFKNDFYKNNHETILLNIF